MKTFDNVFKPLDNAISGMKKSIDIVNKELEKSKIHYQNSNIENLESFTGEQIPEHPYQYRIYKVPKYRKDTKSDVLFILAMASILTGCFLIAFSIIKLSFFIINLF